jgi:hypothetical protein
MINSPGETLLGTNLNFIFDNIKGSMHKSNKNLIFNMNANAIEEKIEQYLSVRADEKDKFGEVFTPVQLIEEMLDELPKNVWSNPELKWLDPANGIGNFPMVVYKHLFKGLEKWEPNEETRSDWIIQKMLYMVELNPKNVKISKQIFGNNANICCADFLKDSEKCFTQFKTDSFDIIIGNPPFNASQENEGKKGGGDSLWPKFVDKSIDLLVSNGYLVFVHPSAWRKPESDSSKTSGLFQRMAHDNHIQYLEIHDTKDGLNVFNVGTRYDWYVLKKHKSNSNSIIKDQKGIMNNINLSKWKFLPNYDISKIKNFLSNNEEDYVLYSRNQFGTDKKWTSETKSEEYKYPLVHSTPSDKPRFYWSSTKNPDVRNTIEMFGVPKVIFGESGINEVILDTDGKYGLTQGAIGLKVKNEKEGKNVKKALESSEFKNILTAMSFGNFRIDWRMFKYFNPDFYKYFLGNENATKIQALTRGKLQRKKTKHTKKIKDAVIKIQALTRGKLQRKKTNKSIKKGGTRKKSIFKFW